MFMMLNLTIMFVGFTICVVFISLDKILVDKETGKMPPRTENIVQTMVYLVVFGLLVYFRLY